MSEEGQATASPEGRGAGGMLQQQVGQPGAVVNDAYKQSMTQLTTKMSKVQTQIDQRDRLRCVLCVCWVQGCGWEGAREREGRVGARYCAARPPAVCALRVPSAEVQVGRGEGKRRGSGGPELRSKTPCGVCCACAWYRAAGGKGRGRERGGGGPLLNRRPPAVCALCAGNSCHSWTQNPTYL